ncbi:MAG: MogA/MoaB family molybdenum cofactor biosynthesis protein [Enterococcaceae bacterium]|jgi:molybdenum cofactor synthesis domain-containing protein|nr:MogA/MoaB family molybdenum cofactor biosynthesis protein [Enterococcaceae bacterium]MCI1918869.1 MogA/MoaB family molybdenum cofactor biosynthesis protein [Enterococcaceae bacterium]
MTKPYRVAVLTLSDKGSKGQRVDVSGPTISEFLQMEGYEIVAQKILPDEQAQISAQLKEWADENTCDLIMTTGGTGFSPRDVTPEATLAVAEKNVPGIAEALRYYSLKITPRAMLSRGVAAIRKKTLIVNLPGSAKAVSESLEWITPQLEHGLDILTGAMGDHD